MARRPRGRRRRDVHTLIPCDDASRSSFVSVELASSHRPNVRGFLRTTAATSLRTRSFTRSLASLARTHAHARPSVWYARWERRDTRERPCICFAYIRHGFEHGHTEHNLGESINDRIARAREREDEGRKRRRRTAVKRGRTRGKRAVGGEGNPGRGPTSHHFRFYRCISGHGTIFSLRDPPSARIPRSSS